MVLYRNRPQWLGTSTGACDRIVKPRSMYGTSLGQIISGYPYTATLVVSDSLSQPKGSSCHYSLPLFKLPILLRPWLAAHTCRSHRGVRVLVLWPSCLDPQKLGFFNKPFPTALVPASGLDPESHFKSFPLRKFLSSILSNPVL